MAIVGMVRIDGIPWRFCGRCSTQAPAWYYQGEPSAMTQIDVSVDPLTTTYTFEAAGVRLIAKFFTPLFLDDLDVLSRPTSYLSVGVESTDGMDHDVRVYVDISAEACVDTPEQRVVWGRNTLTSASTRETRTNSAEDGNGSVRGKREVELESLYIGTWEQNILGRRGDDVRIDWGYLHLVVPDAVVTSISPAEGAREQFLSTGNLPEDTVVLHSAGEPVNERRPVLAAVCDLGSVGSKQKLCRVVFGYDDLYSIQYFDSRLRAYCFRDGATFDSILLETVNEMNEMAQRVTAFDSWLRQESTRIAGHAFADICALAYRQAIAAHKLVAGKRGEPLFFSKECFSNGSIATVDVTYPSTPLFFLFNPDLVAAMLQPIFDLAESELWPKRYAPHDAGTYPRATGQTYGVDLGEIDENRQMPVEECGNMLILCGVHARLTGNTQFAEQHWDTLIRWASYLREHGYDPSHQLCTDDFAGHLARNTNLSLKTILGLYLFGELCECTGRTGKAEEYRSLAHEYAERWEQESLDGDHHMLSFDAPGTWSLKYNLIWDRIFDLHLFSDSVYAREIDWYRRKANRYGTPLDNRDTFTKADWLVWVASLSDDEVVLGELVDPLWRYLSETASRTPFSDWYGTTDAAERCFHHRSVVGGVFMPLLKHALRTESLSGRQSWRYPSTAGP